MCYPAKRNDVSQLIVIKTSKQLTQNISYVFVLIKKNIYNGKISYLLSFTKIIFDTAYHFKHLFIMFIKEHLFIISKYIYFYAFYIDYCFLKTLLVST